MQTENDIEIQTPEQEDVDMEISDEKIVVIEPLVCHLSKCFMANLAIEKSASSHVKQVRMCVEDNRLLFGAAKLMIEAADGPDSGFYINLRKSGVKEVKLFIYFCFFLYRCIYICFFYTHL